MNTAQIHLALNHMPVIIIPVGLVIFLVGSLVKSRSVVKVGAWCLVVAGVLVLPAYFTGEGAEEIVEHLPGVLEDFIEEHEEAALPAAVLGGVTALLAAVYLIAARAGRIPPKVLSASVVVCAVAAVILFVRTAHLGGLIRHQELRSGFVAVTEKKSH
jgi:uncharacterized membrane protein